MFESQCTLYQADGRQRFRLFVAEQFADVNVVNIAEAVSMCAL